MAIVIITPNRDTQILRKKLAALLPSVSIEHYPDIKSKAAVKMAVLWKQTSGCLDDFQNLTAIHSFGAGVDHIISDKTIPAHLPVARIVDPNLGVGMRRYVSMAVLNFHKNLYFHLRQQQQKQWGTIDQAETKMRIGVMGLGQLGQDIAQHLLSLGFEVFGYSKRPKHIEGVTCFSADAGELSAFLKQVNTLVCLMPLTAATKGMLNIDLFRQLPKGSFLINVGRGQHLVEDDLLIAINEGYIAGACLDVLNQEPLDQSHPFWTHPAVILTPHIASVTNQESAAAQIAANYKRVLAGERMLHQIDLGLGY